MSSSRAKVSPTSSCRRKPRGSALLATCTGAAVGIIVAVTTSFVVVALETNQQAQRTSPAAPVERTPGPSKVPSATPPAQRTTPSFTSSVGAAVGSLPAGLSCQDLRNNSLSYVAAFQYWRMHGNPVAMDANRDGIPCETVYSAAAVNAFWRQ